MEFTYDDESHTYRLGSVVLPSVTQIIEPLYDFSGVHRDVMRRAREYGNAVHLTVKFFLNGTLDETDMDPVLVPPLDAFREWQHKEGLDFSGSKIEVPQYHHKLFYAGTPDLDDPDLLVDLKTRKYSHKTDPLQLAAYDHFGSGKRPRFILELKQDGTYVYTQVNRNKAMSLEAWSRFRFLLDHNRNLKTIQDWRTA